MHVDINGFVPFLQCPPSARDVRVGKGATDRITMLPQTLKAPLLEHLKRAENIHERDLADGRGRVLLPDAIDRKYPSAPGEWRWQWVFPQENRWKNEKTSEEGRHHVHESIIQKAVNSAVRKAGLAKRAMPHLSTFVRHAAFGKMDTTSGRCRNFSTTRT